jgi:hypothetical protein
MTSFVIISPLHFKQVWRILEKSYLTGNYVSKINFRKPEAKCVEFGALFVSRKMLENPKQIAALRY